MIGSTARSWRLPVWVALAIVAGGWLGCNLVPQPLPPGGESNTSGGFGDDGSETPNGGSSGSFSAADAAGFKDGGGSSSGTVEMYPEGDAASTGPEVADASTSESGATYGGADAAGCSSCPCGEPRDAGDAGVNAADGGGSVSAPDGGASRDGGETRCGCPNGVDTRGCLDGGAASSNDSGDDAAPTTSDGGGDEGAVGADDDAGPGDGRAPSL